MKILFYITLFSLSTHERVLTLFESVKTPEEQTYVTNNSRMNTAMTLRLFPRSSSRPVAETNRRKTRYFLSTRYVCII